MYKALTTAAMILASGAAFADAEKFELDASHSQVVFSYDHLGFSKTYNMFSGFGGEIMFDRDNPAASSVTVSIPLMSLFTGWEKRFGHFMSSDFLNGKEGDTITFTSTSIEVTGDDTAKITGDLTIQGKTATVVLDTVMNKDGQHPMAGKAWLGFDATTTILRSDYGVGGFAPAVSDAMDVIISIEAAAAE